MLRIRNAFTHAALFVGFAAAILAGAELSHGANPGKTVIASLLGQRNARL